MCRAQESCKYIRCDGIGEELRAHVAAFANGSVKSFALFVRKAVLCHVVFSVAGKHGGDLRHVRFGRFAHGFLVGFQILTFPMQIVLG